MATNTPTDWEALLSEYQSQFHNRLAQASGKVQFDVRTTAQELNTTHNSVGGHGSTVITSCQDPADWPTKFNTAWYNAKAYIGTVESTIRDNEASNARPVLKRALGILASPRFNGKARARLSELSELFSVSVAEMMTAETEMQLSIRRSKREDDSSKSEI